MGTISDWWRKIWVGNTATRLFVGAALALALVALTISGSLSQVALVLFTSTRSIEDQSLLTVVRTAFVHEVIDTPGLVIEAIKTVFAVVVAFVATSVIRNVRGGFTFKSLGVKASGEQSKLIVFCMVFALVKWG